MSASDNWLEGNACYLAAALSWLRLRLEYLADGRLSQTDALARATPLPSADPAAGKAARKSQPKGTPKSAPVDAAPVEPADPLRQAEQELALCQAQMNSPPALILLSERFGLSAFEQHILLLCSAMELDTRTAELCARAQGNATRCHPTFALAMALFPDAAWDAVSPERPLRRWRLIDIHQNHAHALTTSPLRADERIVNYIKGLNHLDERLMAMLAPLGAAENRHALQPSQQAKVEQIAHAWNLVQGPQWPVIQLLGSNTPSKHLLARHAAERFGRQLYRLSVDLLPANQTELEAFARLWQRECMLLPIALYIECADCPASAQATLNRFLSRCEGLFFVEARELLPQLGRSHIVVDVVKPTPIEQREAWRASLGAAAGTSPAALAAQFNLGIATIQRIAAEALAEEQPEPVALKHSLWDACKSAVRPGLDALTQRIDAKATWDDIVLPAEQLALLRQIGAQVRCRSQVYEDWGFARKMNRGLGISALFEGASGVGKTMAAEVIANDLRLNLYRIDLSTVISKYIGETEGNLRRLFDAAEDGGAILFFDECDALFGKRSEVKDSHDRYANIETNYLLQRVEAYRGLAILATNMKSSLDTAFMRRLRFIVNFPFPGPSERRLIWQKAFPPDVPREELDYERLGRINLAGGSIHSAALCAAFLAAQGRSAVDMGLILLAIRTEFMKLGRPINEADFRVLREGGVVA